VGLLSPHINTDVTNVFLKQFDRELQSDVHVVLVWDRAGFHISKELKTPANFTVVPLPAYSPELNPVENLWHYFHSHYWANRIYDDYDDLCAAAVVAWQNAALNPDIIKSVCRASYAERIN